MGKCQSCFNKRYVKLADRPGEAMPCPECMRDCNLCGNVCDSSELHFLGAPRSYEDKNDGHTYINHYWHRACKNCRDEYLKLTSDFISKKVIERGKNK